ncbi:MAG TPA: hypothetical protein VE262_12175 [Blastocatellia bacterium]|jgi:hypothetical protein|nr:hypothetical protein [Blastocatellia bacterium]
MLNRPDPSHELDAVEMLIRALSDEMMHLRSYRADDESSDAVMTQMEEALYRLRLRKMALSVLN